MGWVKFYGVLSRDVCLKKSFFVLAVACIALSGCAAKEARKSFFYPKPPNSPHLQYLTSFSIGRDLEGERLFPFLHANADKNNIIVKPYGIAVKNGRIYVTDTALSRLMVIDLNEKKFSPVDNPLIALRLPANLNLDEKGNIYVADTLRQEIVIVDPMLQSSTAVGNELKMKPTDVAVTKDRLFVVDNDQNELKILDRETGKLIKAVGKNSDPKKGLSLPTNLMLDEKNGFMYITNQGTGKVVKMDLDGNILKSIGGFGDRFGLFSRPKGVFVDDDGYIYVVDAGNQVVQIFNQEGKILMFFGQRGSGPGTLDLPADIFVTREKIDYLDQFVDPGFVREKLIFITNQTGPRKVSVFAMGHAREEAANSLEAVNPQESIPEQKKIP
ncbi:MAG: hypothetical protein HYS23_06895 [Geobacter sp.]|nr:hypothetical protein [Geobacter sp.]